MDPVLSYIFLATLFLVLFCEVFLLITYFENKKNFSLKYKKTPNNPYPTNAPSVTIIVPCFNEERTLAQTIQSLLDLNYPKEKLSIYIVNDGSTDSTATVAEKYLTDPRIAYFYKINEGKYSALNLGILHSKSDLIGCLDADSFVSKDTLLHIIETFQKDEDIMAVTPAIRVYKPETIIQKIQETEYVLGIVFKKLLACLNAQYVTPGPFSIYKKSVFEKVGGFKHAHQTEDMEIAMRMHANKLRIENALDAEVYTVAPRTLMEIIGQRLRWTYGFIKNSNDYRHMFFRKKYGNLGMFSLPMAIISLCTVMYAAFYIIFRTSQYVVEKTLEIQTVGFLSPFKIGEINWFFLNTEIISILAVQSLLLFAVLLFISIHRVRGTFTIKPSDFYFIFLYKFIMPLWIGKTIIKLFSRMPMGWRS